MDSDVTLKQCPYCGEDIRETAILCRFCNRPMPGHENDVPPAVVQREELPEEPDDSTVELETSGSSEEETEFDESLDPAPTTAKKRSRAWILIGGLVIALAGLLLLNTFSAIWLPISGLPGAPCSVQAEEYLAAMESLLDDWDDANQIASSSSRIALGPAVANLQAVRRQVTDLDPPNCASDTQVALVDYMDTTIDAYIAFMSDESDSTVSRLIDQASQKQDDFLTAWLALKFSE